MTLKLMATLAAAGMDTLGSFHVVVRGGRAITAMQAGLHAELEVANLFHCLTGRAGNNRLQVGTRYCQPTLQHHAASVHGTQIWFPGLPTIAKER